MALLFISCVGAKAQWQTQSVLIKPGWTAVFLHVDASYQTLDQLVGAESNNPITQVWLWRAPSSQLQFITNPADPVTSGTLWATWGRLGTGINNTFNNLVPNAAYLVYSAAATNYTWRLKGKPVVPNYTWSTSGLNFLGFPTASTNAPAFGSFLALAPAFASTATIYHYPGGNLGTGNPQQLFTFHTTPVTRGQAFWMRSGPLFNDYFGPFQVALQSSSGADFGDSTSQHGLHLRNLTSSNVTVTVRLLPSETPPAGQTTIVGVPPVLLRGALNATNLTYGYSSLAANGVHSWALPPRGRPGSDIVVVFGINRYAMTNTPGARYAGILQFTDSLNYTEVNVPVSAVTASQAGLWVGNAVVNQVGNYLKSYQLDTNNAPVIDTNGPAAGTYMVTGINTNMGPVPQPYNLRLIVHNSGARAVLLQRVYYGHGPGTNLVVANREALLDPAQLSTARRISATHLPWSATNVPWNLSGQFVQGSTLTTTATVAYDDQTVNPFLHTYHPDHDNLDASFKTQLVQGAESYQIRRQITLGISAPSDDFASLTTAHRTVYGTYQEAITLAGLAGATRTYNVSGVFSLNRLSTIATLSTQ